MEELIGIILIFSGVALFITSLDLAESLIIPLFIAIFLIIKMR